MRLLGVLFLHFLCVSCSYFHSGNIDVLVLAEGGMIPNAQVQILGYSKEKENTPIQIGRYQTNAQGEVSVDLNFSLFSRFKIFVTDSGLETLHTPAIRTVTAPKWYSDPNLRIEIALAAIPTLPLRVVEQPTTPARDDLFKVVLLEPELTAQLQTASLWRRARREFVSRLVSETRFQGKKGDVQKNTTFDYQIQIQFLQDAKQEQFKAQLFDNKGVLMFERIQSLEENSPEKTASKIYDLLIKQLPLNCNLLSSSLDDSK